MEGKSIHGFMNKAIATQGDKNIVIKAKLFDDFNRVFGVCCVYMDEFWCAQEAGRKVRTRYVQRTFGSPKDGFNYFVEYRLCFPLHRYMRYSGSNHVSDDLPFHRKD